MAIFVCRNITLVATWRLDGRRYPGDKETVEEAFVMVQSKNVGLDYGKDIDSGEEQVDWEDI